MAWKRKSGVVSITTLWALYERRMDGLVRLSRGSGDSHTAQWQASVGTPIDVPEPKTVNWREGIFESRARAGFDSSPRDIATLAVSRACGKLKIENFSG